MKMETRYGLHCHGHGRTIRLNAGLYHIPHPLLLGHRHLSLSLQPLVSVRDLSFISFLVWPGLHTSSFGTGYRCS